MTFVVTRQSNYYDEGALSVEIAGNHDYISPGAYSQHFPGDFEESEDPREIVEHAIQLRKQWAKSLNWTFEKWVLEENEVIPFTLAMNGIIYPTVEDGLTAAGLRRWAKGIYEMMPKCEYCGGIGATEWRDMFGDELQACSQYCADNLIEANLDNEDL